MTREKKKICLRNETYIWIMEAGAFVTFIHINGVVNQKNEKKIQEISQFF